MYKKANIVKFIKYFWTVNAKFRT